MTDRFKILSVFGLALVLATVGFGCAGNPDNPVSPTGTAVGSAAVGPQGETLKTTVPAPTSPIGGVEVSRTPTLVASNATAKFAEGTALSQRIQLMTGGGDIVHDVVVPQGSGTTELRVPGELDFGQVYQWRTQAVFEGAAGLWSDFGLFVTEAPPPPPPSAPGPTPTPTPIPTTPSPGPPSGGSITSISQLCAIVFATPFNAGANHPEPFRDAIIQNSGDPNVGLHMRPNGRISGDVVAVNFPAGGQPYQIADVVIGSTGNNPSPGCGDITNTLEAGSTFVRVN